MNNRIANVTLSLSQAVVKLIEDKILSGDLVTGDKINEYAISSELNISRAPIREAISELQVAGLIEYQPRKSGFISIMTKEDVDEIFDIRISLEKDIIHKVIEDGALNEKHIASLKSIIQDMTQVVEDDAYVYNLNRLDLEFHAYLWNIARSPRRAAMLHNMFMQLVIALNKNTQTLGNIQLKAKEHTAYVAALESRDVKKAHHILEGHIIIYKEELYDKVYG